MNKVSGIELNKVRSLKRVHKTYKPWTAADITFLVANYRSMTPAEIAQRMGRTASSVKNQANKSGCARPHWSEQELHFLRTHAATMTSRQIAKHLGRSQRSIIGAAYMHRISLYKCGDNYPSVKFCDEDVLLIRALADAGVRNADIARKFEISPVEAWRYANKRKTAADAVVGRMLP